MIVLEFRESSVVAYFYSYAMRIFRNANANDYVLKWRGGGMRASHVKYCAIVRTSSGTPPRVHRRLRINYARRMLRWMAKVF